MVVYDPYMAEVIENPHAIYEQLRAEEPVYFIERFGAWALARFEDIWTASMDNDHYTAAQGTTSAHLLTRVQPPTPMINLMDPPTHTEMRARIAGFFTPGKVRRHEAQIRKFVDDAWSAIAGKDEADLYNEFATEVSVKVACLANGFPLEDAAYCNDLVWRFFRRDPEQGEGMTADGLAAMGELTAYFADLVQKRRAGSGAGDSVVDIVCNAEIGGRLFTDEEAGSHLSMFMIGGAETFPKTFASTAHRLWEHKDQRAEVAADPALVTPAYEEVLRYDMPTQFLMRAVTKEHQIRGKTLLPGHSVMFLYPSANRDEEEFENPDVFDIHRRPARILTFGHGTHACIGRHFAKMEGKLCIEKLLAEAPDYEVQADRLSRIQTEFVQGWETMPVTLRP